MIRTSTFLLLAGASLLSACNLAPDYERPAAAVPPTLPQGGVYPALAPGDVDISRIGWRDFFTDARLQTVIAQGLENNRNLRIAAGNVLQARARYRIQRANQLPTVGANAGVTFTNNPFGAQAAGTGGGTGGGTGTTPGTGTGTNPGTGTGTNPGTGTPGANPGIGSTSSDLEIYQVGVGVSAFEIDLFGRLRNLSRAALEQYFATEEAQRATRISLIAEIATAWLTLAADQDQLRLSRDTLGAFEQTRRLTQEQFRIGVASELAFRQADTQYQQALNDIAALETRVAQDRNALDLLVGAPVAESSLPNGLGQGGATIPTLPAGLSSEILLRRPDVLQAERQLRAENANIGAARAARFPTISLTATLGTISTALSGLFAGGSYAYSVAPGVSLPIFDNGRIGSNIRLAEANREVAIATYDRAIQTAFREVADALAQRGTIERQVGAQTTRSQSAQVAARLSDARYRAGIDSFLNALDAQRTSYAAQQQLVTTRLARDTNLVELYRSLGGGLQERDPAVPAEPPAP
ncbi:outer membrane protein, multidrug efflux system [Sphingomonas guangdongensis]|uniref:Outer membrane protein, multidrug efflux system n=1 Tax=Sphingomonas guangdongensis TaxID=1141890 RepID=A0A285R0D5_9SPHN|nr:efflux transporter outer membrane subunit [Sphingomonas guangdongensis]SOB87304.1 outer membrane protein, multidrug efflux system [Sphingomonas guangdongensis]